MSQDTSSGTSSKSSKRRRRRRRRRRNDEDRSNRRVTELSDDVLSVEGDGPKPHSSDTGRGRNKSGRGRKQDAGADMALWSNPDDPDAVLDVLEPALASGELDPAANDAAVTRVLRAKNACT